MIWISEDRYHFDDAKYAKRIDMGLAKISKIVKDTDNKISSIVKSL